MMFLMGVRYHFKSTGAFELVGSSWQYIFSPHAYYVHPALVGAVFRLAGCWRSITARRRTKRLLIIFLAPRDHLSN